jgi:hypothetical protein
MLNYIKKAYYLILVFLVPMSVSIAAAPATFKDFTDIIINLSNSLLVILGTLALIAFLWGITKTIINSDNEETRKTGRKIMIYGLLALFVVFSLNEILTLVRNTFF